MRFNRIATATAVALLAFMTMLLPTQGADAVDQSVTGGPTGWVPLEIYAFSTGQTFTPEHGTLTSVDLYLRTNSGSPTTVPVTVTVDIYRTDTLGIPVVTGMFTVPASTAAGWFNFNFATTPISTSPQQYLIDVRVDNTTDSLSWGNFAPDAYAVGSAFLDESPETYDFMFKTNFEDLTAPVIVSTVTPSLSPNNWYNNPPVGLAWAVTEPESPDFLVKAGCVNQNLTADQDITAYNCSATSVGGSADPVTVQIGIDTVKPVITATRTAPNGAGWNSGTVTVSFSCTDERSGIATNTVPLSVDVSSEGAGQSVTSTGSCVDNAGNAANPVTVNDINIDLTPPTAMLSVTAGTPGSAGWYTSDVTVRTSGTDISPLTCAADQFQTAETTGAVFNGSCTDAVGNVTPAAPLTVKLDKTGPTDVELAVVSGTPGANSWYTSDVTIRTTGTDDISGIASCTGDQLFAGETTGFSVLGSCTNGAGFTTNAVPFNLKIDKTPPITTVTPSGMLGDNGWYISSPVTVTTAGTDDVSSPVVCDGLQTVFGDTAGQLFTGTCTNDAGLSSSASTTVKIDTSPPTANLAVTAGTLGDNGWYTSDVTVTATGTDNVSEPVVCTPVTQSLTAETDGQTFNATCENQAGLQTAAAPLTVKLDKTPPATTVAITDGTLGDNGWYTSDVTVTATGTDTISDPVTCDPIPLLTTETTGQDITGTCTNNAGLSSSASVNVKLDKTGPTANLAVTSGTLGDNSWYTSDVTVSTTGEDDVSGPVTCTADQTQTTDTSGQVFEGSCTNAAGLETDAAALTVKLDKTAPALAPTVPANIQLNSSVAATPNATDATSVVATSSCAAMVTSTAGTQSVTCTATDNAGNDASVTIQYTVLTTSADCGQILFGTKPPLGGGTGTFAFSCGSLPQLLTASGCPQATATFFYNKPGGGFAVWIPGSSVAAANAEFLSIFNGDPPIPVNTIFTVKCV